MNKSIDKISSALEVILKVLISPSPGNWDFIWGHIKYLNYKEVKDFGVKTVWAAFLLLSRWSVIENKWSAAECKVK